MSKVLALDVGAKTIGIAFSDDEGGFAIPAETLLRQPSLRKDMALLRDMISTRGVREIVVGYPLMKDGSRGIQTQKVDAFVKILRNFVRIPIHLQDERYSTAEAESLLIPLKRFRDERKKVIDSLAASLFLQSYLDETRAQAKRQEPSS